MKRLSKQITGWLWVFIFLLSLPTLLISQSSQPYNGSRDESNYSEFNSLDRKAKLKVGSGKDMFGWCLYNLEMEVHTGLMKFNTSDLEVVTAVSESKNQFACAGCFVDEDLDGEGKYYLFGVSDGSGGQPPVLNSMMEVDLKTGNTTQIASYDNINSMFNDADYDYSTSTMYAVAARGENALVFTININDGTFAQVATIPAPIFTMSINFDGEMYGIGLDSYLYKVDTKSWIVEKIGKTGVYPMSLQSMTFDHSDNTLYWSFFNNGVSKLITVDTKTAETAVLGNLGGNSELVGLYIPFTLNRKQPQGVSNLVIAPKPNGEEKATLSWVNPTKNLDKSNITTLTKIEVFRDGSLVHMVSNQTVGGNVSWEDSSVKSGIHSYVVIAHSDIKGVGTTKNAFIGRDVPNAPSNVKLAKNENNAVLTWDKVANGCNGGWIDVGSLKYRIIRMPDNVVIAETSDNKFEDTSIDVMNLYTYAVEGFNSDGYGGRSFSNSMIIGPAFSTPCTFTFPTIEEFLIWTRVDSNEDGKTWNWGANDNLAYCQAGTGIANDDWLISPSLKLEANKKYRISYSLALVMPFGAEKIKATIGRGVDITSQDVVLGDYDNIMNMDKINYVVDFTPEESGEYNLKFYSYSPPGGYQVYVADVDIREHKDHNLIAVELSGTKFPVVNFEYEYTFKYKNIGIGAEGNYKIELINEKDRILQTITDVKPIDANTTISQSFKWMPLSTDDANGIRCRLVMAGDDDDNVSKTFDVNIQPVGSADYVEIGSGSRTSGMPISLDNLYSGTQTLYLKEEMKNMAGLIEQISYNVASTSGVDGVEVEIYMANTDLRTLMQIGSLPKDDFTLVYDGTMSLPASDKLSKWEITLEKEFLYLGESVVVMVAAKSNKLFDVNFLIYDDAASFDNIERMARTSAYWSNDTPFNYGSQYVYMIMPQINVNLQRNGGATINGLVTENATTPVPDVMVSIEKLNAKSYTNELGEYQFPYLLSDSYDLLFSKFGYKNKTVEAVDLMSVNKKKVDLELEKMAQYDVNGKCVNMLNETLEGVKIKMTGYTDYSAVSASDGTFVVNHVFAADGEYAIEANTTGYLTYKGTMKVSNGDVNLEIKLTEMLYSPAPVVATIVDNAVELTWDGVEKVSTFRYDDGIVSGQIGSTAMNIYNIMGTAFRVPTIVNKVSWFLTSEGGPHEKVNIFIFELDEKGNPTNNLIKEVSDVQSSEDEWSSYTFDTPLNCTNGFLFALSYNGFLALGLDSGKSVEYPFIENTHYTCENHVFMPFKTVEESADFRQNYMLRVEGIAVGSPIEFADNKFSKIADPDMTLTASTCEPRDVNMCLDEEEINEKNQLRSMIGYKVWRFLEKDKTSIENWTLLTESSISESTYKDGKWNDIANGAYQYGVRAVYSGNIESGVRISNVIGKNMNASVAINVSTNTPLNESMGAKIVLANSDGNSQHVYNGTIDASGKIEFTNVWKGTYSLTIKLDGFETLSDNKEINEDSNTLSYVLTEKIVKPYGLAVKENVVPYQRVFSWNNSYGINEDFENHEDFAINSAGDIGWNYVDGDGAKTVVMGPASYPNIGKKMAAMIFNPRSTIPTLKMDEIQAHSGTKYVSMFASMGMPNNDWIISPVLDFEIDFVLQLYAKSLTADFGAERMKIAYSTTGFKQGDFNNWVHTGDYVEVSAGAWKMYEYSIPANAKYVAINCVSDDAFMLMIDDIYIGMNKGGRKLVNYNVFLDNVKIGESSTTEYVFDKLTIGNHKAGVQAVYTSGSTEIIEKDFIVTLVGVDECEYASLVFYPNPVMNCLNINGKYDKIELLDIGGKVVKVVNAFTTSIDMQDIESGCYIIRVYNDGNVSSHKIIKQL